MPKLVADEDVIDAYKSTGSVWKAAKRLGICGQSVWERLKHLGHHLPGCRWTVDEDEELRSLAGQCTISEIARRLGRPYGAVATRISEKGLSHRKPSRKVKLHGTGLTKESVGRMTSELDVFKGTVTQFCRQRGFSVDVFAGAVQKYAPDFWQEYTKRVGLEAIDCEYCQNSFYPLNKKQKTCTRKCQRDLRADKQYFAGNRRGTIGLAEGVCQLCETPKSSLSSHHVWGKENDPEAEFLIALCSGCHELVSRLGSRKLSGDAGFIERLVVWANMRRNGYRKPLGFHCYVECEEMTNEDLESSW